MMTDRCCERGCIHNLRLRSSIGLRLDSSKTLQHFLIAELHTGLVVRIDLDPAASRLKHKPPVLKVAHELVRGMVLMDLSQLRTLIVQGYLLHKPICSVGWHLNPVPRGFGRAW